MNKNLILLFLFICFNIYSNTEKITIRNFGIISIGDDSNYLGKHQWDLSFSNMDSLFSYSIKTKANDKFIYFNLSKTLNKNLLNYFSKNITEYIIKKDDKVVFSSSIKLNFLPQNLYVILRKNIPNNKVKGKILDSYAVEDHNNYYYLVRTILNNQILCWYIIKNDEIVNIHTEKNHSKHEKFGRITITNFSENKPQYTFIYKNQEVKKIITLGDKIKLISVINKDKIKLPKITKGLPYLEYRGYIYYNKNQNG